MLPPVEKPIRVKPRDGAVVVADEITGYDFDVRIRLDGRLSYTKRTDYTRSPSTFEERTIPIDEFDPGFWQRFLAHLSANGYEDNLTTETTRVLTETP